MTENFLAELVQHQYGVQVVAEPLLLSQRDEQRIFKLELAGDKALVLRLCDPRRAYGKVLADSEALLFLNRAEFAVPRLRLTRSGERIFEWEAGRWAYAYDFVPGQNVRMDTATLEQTAQLMATLHNLVHRRDEYPLLVSWLADLQPSIANVERYVADPQWGKQAQEVAQTLQSLPDLKVLPRGLIHTDIHEGNLLRDPDGKLWLLDWEDAGLGEMPLDMAVVLGWYCVQPKVSVGTVIGGKPELYDFDEVRCCAFLDSYQSVRRLEQVEVELLGAALKFVMGWYAARDIGWEVNAAGSSGGEAWSNWAIMRSVTPAWEATLSQWANKKQVV